MPNIDGFETRRRHILDRNKHDPNRTLCGENIEIAHYFTDEAQFHHVNCKTCRSLFFGEPL